MAQAESGGFQLEEDKLWDTLTKKVELDPALRRIASLIERANYEQGWKELYRRTGIKHPALGGSPQQTVELPLLIEFDPRKLPATQKVPQFPGLTIPKAYEKEVEIYNKRKDPRKRFSNVTARLKLDPKEIFDEKNPKADKLRVDIANLLTAVKRISVAAPLQPCFEESLVDVGMPAKNNTPREYEGHILDGNDIVIGIIDDGCSFAHPDFRKGNATRVKHLWHQSKEADVGINPIWAVPADFPYGSEIDDGKINLALRTAKSVEEVYTNLGYDMPLASHGTHVMGIAAANPRSLISSEGVACAADIIFVQLPVDAIESGGAVLYNHILDGVLYIFSKARKLGKPAVINISYGGYTGPHDGSTELERAIDQLLDSPNPRDRISRSVVIAAGNGFEADCHAYGEIKTKDTSELHWVLKPQDPTSNLVEIWYNGDAELKLWLRPPGAKNSIGPIFFNEPQHILQNAPGGKVLAGSIDHVQYPGNQDKRITIVLGPTADKAATGVEPVPPGMWTISLEKRYPQGANAKIHAWIERDASGGRGSARLQQSYFLPENSGGAIFTPDPACTLGAIATGKNTIAVGAYNSATQELSRYTACGPTRDGRKKPEICAPSEGDSAGRGILSSSSLRSQPTRMNGTSASAPHVVGALALMYQYIRDANRPGKTAVELRAAIQAGATKLTRRNYNRHQEADEKRQGRRQSDLGSFDDLTGSGKLKILASLDVVRRKKPKAKAGKKKPPKSPKANKTKAQKN